MKLRAAIPGDIRRMMELDRASPTAAHWTEAQYRHALLQGSEDPERLVLVAEVSRATAAAVEEGGRGFPILGFLLARHLAPEWELENIAVAPGARRKGLGTQLLKALLARARETGAQAVFLEVRESNTAARRLYEKAGFQQAGRRKSYYADPPDDAVLYRHSLI